MHKRGTKSHAFNERVLMFAPGDYRKHALAYADRLNSANTDGDRNKLQSLEKRFRELADNEQWLADNHDKIVTSDGGP